jgi:hypothetical protein
MLVLDLSGFSFSGLLDFTVKMRLSSAPIASITWACQLEGCTKYFGWEVVRAEMEGGGTLLESPPYTALGYSHLFTLWPKESSSKGEPQSVFAEWAREVTRAGHWRLTPVILATQEAEIRRMVVRSQPGQIVCEILSQKTLHKCRAQGVGLEFKLQYYKKKKKKKSEQHNSSWDHTSLCPLLPGEFNWP